MITREHEASIDFYEQLPDTLSTVLKTCNIPVPEGANVDFWSGRFTETEPSELNADGLALVSTDDQPTLAVIIEVQRDGGDKKRRLGQASLPDRAVGALP